MTFRHAIAIQAADIDHMGHVNNAVYLRWVQEAVVRYWEAVAPAEAVAQHLWVALKHEISYRKPAFLDDGLIAEVIAERVHAHGPSSAPSSGAARKSSPTCTAAGAASTPPRFARRGWHMT